MFVFQSVVNFRLVAKGLWVGSVLITVYWDSGGRVAPGLREMEGCQLGLRDGRPWITEVGRSECSGPGGAEGRGLGRAMCWEPGWHSEGTLCR